MPAATSSVATSGICSATRSRLVRDQNRTGKEPAEIRQYLRTFDVWDRYDYDEDGDFDEPTGTSTIFRSSMPGR